jgi:hypothetical protein
VSEVEEMVENAKKPGVFNIVDAVKGRGYPTTEIDVFLDEDVAYMAAQIEVELSKLGAEMDRVSDTKELSEMTKIYEEFIDKKENMINEMGGTKYTFHLRGISEGDRSDLYDKAVELYPLKFENDRNPLTGESNKKEIESEPRNKYFTDMLWSAYIVKIVAPDGAEQVGISVDDAKELRRSLPIASASKITDAIEKMRAATAIFMLSVNEDFLAKS